MTAIETAAAAPRCEPREQGMEQWVVFSLLGESYALPVGQVREVIRLPAITALPKSAPCIEGVIRLRGRVIGVLDLRKRLDLPIAERTNATRILIARMPNALVGLIVDSVQEVLSIPCQTIQSTPDVVKHPAGAHYSTGIARMGDRLILLLDLMALLPVEDVQQLEAVKAQSSKGDGRGENSHRG